MQTRDTFDRAIAEDREAAHLRQQLQGLRREEGAAREGLARLGDTGARREAAADAHATALRDSVLRVDTAVASVREAMQRLTLRSIALDQRLAKRRRNRGHGNGFSDACPGQGPEGVVG